MMLNWIVLLTLFIFVQTKTFCEKKLSCSLGTRNKIKLCVVYFNQLLGAARTQKLVETLFSPMFSLFC